MAAVGLQQILENVNINRIALKSRCCSNLLSWADEVLPSVQPAAAADAHGLLTVLHLSKSIQAWAREETAAGISSLGNGWYVTETGEAGAC